VGAALMVLAFCSFVTGFLCLKGAYDRQQVYFDQYCISGKIQTEDVTYIDEDGEHSKKTYILHTDKIKAREFLDIVHGAILIGTPLLLGFIGYRKLFKLKEGKDGKI
jgi:hypothetical protein